MMRCILLYEVLANISKNNVYARLAFFKMIFSLDLRLNLIILWYYITIWQYFDNTPYKHIMVATVDKF